MKFVRVVRHPYVIIKCVFSFCFKKVADLHPAGKRAVKAMNIPYDKNKAGCSRIGNAAAFHEICVNIIGYER